MKSKKTKLIALFICLMLVISLGIMLPDSNREKGTVPEVSEGTTLPDTEYGTIPTADMTSDKNFAIFAKKANEESYTYIGTRGSLVSGALNGARDLVKRNSGTYAGGTVVVYLLKDYDSKSDGNFNRAMMIDGTLILDLGGNKLTASKDRVFGFETGGSDVIGTASEYSSTVKIVNGTIATNNPVVEVFGGSSTYTGTKQAGASFENVTFEPLSGTDARTLVKSRNSFGSTQGVDFDVNFTDCTFNYATTNGVVLYNDTATGGDGTNPVVADVKVNGGDIKVADLSKLTLRTDTANDTFTFAQNADGNRTTFTLNYTENAPDATFVTDAGTMNLASEAITNEIVSQQAAITYSLSNVKAGDYGYVPLSQSSKTFSVFYNSLHVASYDNLNDKSTGGLNGVKNLLYGGNTSDTIGALQGETLTIYTNKDYENNVTTNRFDNYAQIGGTIVLDLGGHTITQKTNAYLFNLTAKAVDGKLPTTSTIVKNGKILTTSHEIMIVQSDGTTGNFGYEGTKTFDFTFDNVTFDKHSSYASYYAPLVKVDTFKDNSGKKNVAYNATFDNCTFNSNDSVLFNFATSNYVDANITINGGSLTAHTMGEAGLMNVSDSDDKLTMGEYDGSKTTFTLDFAENGPTAVFTTADGKMGLAAENVTADSISQESLIEYTLSNVKAGDNGYIPLGNEGHTFYVFYNNLYMSYYDSLNDSAGAVNAVKTLMYGGNTKGKLAGKTVTIYMNKDYELAVNSYANYAQIDGTVVFDLGGHTLTQPDYMYLFNLTSKAVDGKLPTTATKVKNGTILTTSEAIMKIQSGSNFEYTGTKTFNFTYDNVTFEKHESKATYYAPLAQVVSFSDNSGTKNVVLDATFNNCTFNIYSKSLFECTESNYVDVNATINGGSITVHKNADKPAITATDFMKGSNSEDKLTFGTYNGEYTTLHLPTGVTAPTEKFNDGMFGFVLDSETADESIYKLVDEIGADLRTYAPKMSLTLHSTLRMNIYIPEELTQTYTLDGVEKDYDSKVTLDDGKVYYRKSIKLTSSDAIRDVVLKVTVTAGGKDVNGTFTFSVLKYANKIFASGKNVDKQLIRDVLSYVRASYNYFEPDNTDAIAKIDALIGVNYEQLTPFTPEEVTVNPTSFKAATFYLGDTPAFRFYLNDGDTAEYSFKIDGVDVNASSGSDANGAYLQIAAYAYAMDDVITYYVDGTEVGSYHIANYYEWATGENNAALVNVVERFWVYCQSAKDYKDSVEVQIKYVDEAGTELATTYTNTYKSGEEFSVLSPSVSGYYTRDVYKIDSVTEDTVFEVVYKKIPSNVDATTAKTKLPDIVAWGDSITIGSGKNELTSANTYGIDLEALGSTTAGGDYPTVLKNLIASRVYSGIADIGNCGVGGETTSSIAARADTRTYYLYLDGAVTISTSEVEVPLTHYASTGRIGILRQGGKPTVNPVTITGLDSSGNVISVTGTLNRTLTDDAPADTNPYTCDAKYLKYTFTRTDGGTDTLNFVSGARVTSKSSYLYDGRSCIIFMGENGGYSDINELIKQQEEILEACGNPDEYLIVSTTSGSNSSRAAMEKALTERWGDRYISMGHELNSSRKAYELVGYSEADIVSVLDNIIDGTVTKLLIKDNCHPNAVGYAAIGNIMFERLYKLGSFDEIFDYYDRLQKVKTESFDFNGYTATVIRPANPNGKWIWKTEFFDAFDQAEEALLDQGYTRVYYKISNMYGSPEAVSLMKNFHQEVIKRYNLDDKGILFGFSRGGLYAFNFALTHPECVDKVYLDNPVLDLTTWPTKAKNPSEYAGMLASYGLTEETFASFKGSPVDKLEEFFANDIPVLIVAGDADQTVPFEKNAGRLIDYANANGHDITYIVEEGKDHHPHSLTDVTPILDFCNKPSMVSNPLTKADFSGKTITFMGDSITYGVGVSDASKRYSTLVATSLGMTENNMGISGSIMCMEGASTRESRADDIPSISLDSDYVGILLGVNDFDACRYDAEKKYSYLGKFGSKDPTTVYGALDKMCSDLVERFGATDTKIFMMTPVITSWNNSVTSVRDWDQSKKNACGYTLRDLCDAIEKVATHYGIITLDLNQMCQLEPSDFSDGIHPNDSGAQKIANTVEKFLLANYSFE